MRRPLGMIVPQIWESGVNYDKFRAHILGEKAKVTRIVNLPFNVFVDAYIDTAVVIFQRQTDLPTQYEYLSKAYGKYDSAANLTVAHHIRATLQIEDARKGKTIIVGERSKLHDILADDNTYMKLSAIADCVQGPVESFLTLGEMIEGSGYKGQVYAVPEVGRYECEVLSKWELRDFPKNTYDKYYSGKRILARRILSRQDRLLFGFAEDPFVCKKDFNPIVLLGSTKYSPYALLSILNSKLISKLYIAASVISSKDDFRQTTLKEMLNLPISKFNFDAPAQQEKLTALTNAYQISSNATMVDDLVNALSRSVGKEYICSSCVSHDFISYLGEQMIQLNRSKQPAQKAFLSWIEKQIKNKVVNDDKSGLDALTGKTVIKEYLGDYQKSDSHASFEALLDVLQKNKNRIARPLDSVFQTRMHEEYEKSLTILLPIKEKLAATDRLIDQIVYRLYGLTDEEIAVVDNHG